MPTARERMTGKLAELAASGVTHVGVYGAGLHTQRLADVLAASPVKVAAVIDDDPARVGQTCADIAVIPPSAAAELNIQAVVISSDRCEEQIWRNRAALTSQGIAVHRLYQDGPTRTHYEAAWDNYARYWDPSAKRLMWDDASSTFVPHGDQSAVEHPGDEWGFARRAFQRLVEPVLTPDSVVLEIGPGSGRITEHVLPRCKELHAVEISDEMIEALHRRLGDPPNLFVHKVSDVDLSMFPDETFDAAFSIGVFVHLQMEDTYRYLRDLRRVLKPGGCFVIDGVCDLEGEPQWQRFLSKVADFDAGRRDDPTCFHFTSRDALAKFCAKLGWEVQHGNGIRFRRLSEQPAHCPCAL